MQINHNFAAAAAYRAASNHQSGVDTSLERLSSGLRINRAADDAAGLAIAENLRAQSNGLAQAQQNTLDGISLLQTAEGGLNETHALLQRMRTLAVQAANGVNSPEQLRDIQLEMGQLTKAIDDIAYGSEFNGMPLLDGTFIEKNFQVGANVGDTAVVSIASGRQWPISAQPAGIALWDVDDPARLAQLQSPVTVTQTLTGTTPETVNTASVVLDPLPTSTTELVDRLNADPGFAALFTVSLGAHNTATTSNPDANLVIMAKTPGAGSVEVSGVPSDTSATQRSGGQDAVPARASGGYSAAELLGGVDVSRPATTYSDPGGTYTSGPGDVTGFGNQDYQNGGGTYTVPPSTWTSPSGATDAIATIDRAISIVSRGRAEIGAMQNRFEHAARSLGVAHENMAQSESRIRDADVAKEITDLRRHQVLCQSSISMMSQANQFAQSVLKLLQ